MNLSDEVDLYIRGLSSKPSQVEAASFKVLCERTGLSPVGRQIYLVSRGNKFSAQVSIDGFRAIAARNPRYIGQDGPFYLRDSEGAWTDVPPEGAPYAAKVGVRVRTEDGPVTTYAVAKYKDYNAGGPMWTKFSSTMLAKCAESLALRKAFPAEMGGLYTAEEMAQAGPAEPIKEPSRTEAVTPEWLMVQVYSANSRDELKRLVALASNYSDEDQSRIAAAVRGRALELP